LRVRVRVRPLRLGLSVLRVRLGVKSLRLRLRRVRLRMVALLLRFCLRFHHSELLVKLLQSVSQLLLLLNLQLYVELQLL
jgi:hypothetical protein